MNEIQPFRNYNLNETQQSHSTQAPFAHQNQALKNIGNWLASVPKSNAGGIVVLPTGGGKTFTAIRFLCTSVIPKGYKVLWLAHTHHLLDQAFLAFEKSVGTIPKPKSKLSTRLVSGDPAHDGVREVDATDDVIVATLQTITMAYQDNHPALMRFLKGAGDKLCVVFDEAHHAPAPSYRKLLKAMRADHAEMILIGLTATPTSTNPKKEGWLLELFPQGIIHQSNVSTLIADRILARPNFEKIPTNITPEFDEAEYSKWVETYRDLPESIIESLADNRVRNALIASHYASNRDKYGKTIIFAERWHQCEQIEEFLKRQGIRAGSIFSRVDASLATVEARNARTSDTNRRNLEKYKNGEIDVLINVNMLIEGTDVPKTQTVFITRQTTSTVRLTQMVGRALRGPRAGGTKDAFIVSFEDNWKQKINWAGFDQVGLKPIGEDIEIIRKRRLIQMISIDLVRQLLAQMDSGINVTPTDFLKLIPVGWYQVEIDSIVQCADGSSDVETALRLVMVFDDQSEGYRKFLEELTKVDLSHLSSECATFADAEMMLNDAANRFFPNQRDQISCIDIKDLFDVARHVAQNDGVAPQFFPFEGRGDHDLDAIVKEHYEKEYSDKKKEEVLPPEFHRSDRFWQSLYPSFDMFKSQYDACMNRLSKGIVFTASSFTTSTKKPRTDHEPSTELKREVKKRDNYRCLCCGESNKRYLQVDHINPWYLGGDSTMDNLQTLCKDCNREKGKTHKDFRIKFDPRLALAPTKVSELYVPEDGYEAVSDVWIKCVQQVVNLFYNAAAVGEIRIGARGRGYYEWVIQLHEGNRPEWLIPHLPAILEKIRSTRSAKGAGGPEGLRVVGLGVSDASHFVSYEGGDGPSDFLEVPNGTEGRITIDGQSHETILLRRELKFGNGKPFTSFTDAYKFVTGRQRHNWKGWEFRFPNSAEWVRGDEARGRLLSSPDDDL